MCLEGRAAVACAFQGGKHPSKVPAAYKYMQVLKFSLTSPSAPWLC